MQSNNSIGHAFLNLSACQSIYNYYARACFIYSVSLTNYVVVFLDFIRFVFSSLEQLLTTELCIVFVENLQGVFFEVEDIPYISNG